MNYFEFYELPISFQVDEILLKKKYYEISRAYHPDFHTLASDAYQESALDKSTINNQAYKTLSDFDERLKYILNLFGRLKSEGENKVPQDFLMEMMDINENLMELEIDPSTLKRDSILEGINAIEKGAFQEIETLLEKDISTFSDEDWSGVSDYYLKSRYLKRLQENIDRITDGV